MLKQFFIALSRNPGTLSKGKKPSNPRLAMGTLELASETCTRCKKCVEACPAGSLRITEGWIRHDPERCIGCVRCVDACEPKCLKFCHSAAVFGVHPFRQERSLIALGDEE